jgi:hypothetical protein
MDLNFSPAETAFREEVRNFVKEKLPGPIRHKVMNGVHLTRDDHVLWQRTLHQRGWGGPGWPKEFGGPGWTPTEQYVFEEECAAGGAPRLISFGLKMIAPVLMAFGNPAQQQRYLPKITVGRRMVVPGLFGARRRLRPRLGQDPRRVGQKRRRRPLPRQRPEDLDHARAARRLDLLPGPHRPAKPRRRAASPSC